ncbi:MAG: alkaline phosphatase family protein [Desulfohalobiaceae bacterium]
MADKCLLILLDGLGDRSHPELGGRTPLQAARTPNLDRIASLGANGLFHPALQGQAFPSEKAHFALFGYSQREFPGRGLLEALGYGLNPGQGDVALLAHLASASEREGCLFLEREAPEAPQQEDLEQILGALPPSEGEDITVQFHPTRDHFGILLLQGEVSPRITDTNPMRDGVFVPDVLPWEGLGQEEAQRARNTARALKRSLVRARTALKDHPVNARRVRQGFPALNALITQRPGAYTAVPAFAERYGLRGATVASGAVYRGLAQFLGLEAIPVRDGHDPGTDLAKRLETAFRLFSETDFIHVHTKAPDTAAHSKDPRRKTEAIESLDRGLGDFGPERILQESMLLAVTSDHSTPSSGSLVHSGEPVPLSFLSRDARRDGVDRFDETECATGCLGLIRGQEFMYTVLNLLDRAKLAGVMDTPRDQPFWPGKRQPFTLT